MNGQDLIVMYWRIRDSGCDQSGFNVEQTDECERLTLL